MPSPRGAWLEGAKPRKTGEDDIQINLVKHLQWRAAPGVIWFMIPNGTNKSKAAAGKAKAMGLRKGASDMGFIIPPHGQAAMLELKFGKNKPSPEQEQFGVEVEAAGAFFAVAWSLDQAIGILQAWGCLKPDKGEFN